MKIRVRERSFFARMAARKLKSHRVAAVLGNTIHLWNVSREEFMRNRPWVMHELEHVKQFRRHGFVPFLVLYLWESVRKGYRHNRFEVEARLAEMSESKLEGIEFW